MNINKIINRILKEASSIKDRGSYISPLMPGMREFEPNINAPFIKYATEWDDPLLDYDSLDGEMSTKKSVAIKLEKRADKIKKYMETHPDSFAWADEGGVLNSIPGQNTDAKKIKNYNPKKTTVSASGLTKKKVNEANSNRYAGTYNGPLTMGEIDWGDSALGPFNNKVSKYYNPELEYDSYDGSLDSHKKDKKKLETKSRKISKYNKKHPKQNDEDGGIINQTPGKGKRIVPVNEWVELDKIPLNEGTATRMTVLVLNFPTDATTATTYYQLLTEEGAQLRQGNYTLTEEEFASWGTDNNVVNQYVANAIGVVLI